MTPMARGCKLSFTTNSTNPAPNATEAQPLTPLDRAPRQTCRREQLQLALDGTDRSSGLAHDLGDVVGLVLAVQAANQAPGGECCRTGRLPSRCYRPSSLFSNCERA
jgi:hypothetical protein